MPPTPPSLRLHEEVLLLALRDEKGTIATGAWYAFAIGGAVLAELVFERRVSIDDDKKALVTVIDDNPIGDPLLDECLEKIATAKRRAQGRHWVGRFARTPKLRDRVANELCAKGILRADESTVLLIFRRKTFPEINPRPERQLVERLRRAIFGDATVQPRTAVLVALANGTNLLRIPFESKRLKARKKRIERLCRGESIGRATKEAVQAAQAAMVATTCMIPVMVNN